MEQSVIDIAELSPRVDGNHFDWGKSGNDGDGKAHLHQQLESSKNQHRHRTYSHGSRVFISAPHA
jgi:hypothetical protein